MKRLFLILIPLLFIGCATKAPITWEKRVLETQVKPLNLAYDEYGKEHNQTILFLHGFGESRYTWRFLVEELSRKYHIFTLDLKGFGESPKTEDNAYSVYDQAKLVERFIQKHHLSNVTVIGRSFGGGVTLVLALMQEDSPDKNLLNKMVLINSMSYKQRLPSMMRTLQIPIIGYLGIHLLSEEKIAKEAYLYAFSNDALIPQKSVDYSAKMMKLPRAKYAYLETVNTLIPDDIVEIQKRYKEISIPTLILWGKDDVSIRVNMAYRLHKDLRNSQLKIFKNVGHMPQEEIPQKVVKEIINFMDRENEIDPKPKSFGLRK